MNTIPITFDEHQVNRTVIGGRKNTSPDALNISVILLNTGGSHFKLHVFENLLACKFQSVISVEKSPDNFALEDVSKKFPEIKFIIPFEPASDGEMINLAMSEIESDFALVLRDSVYIPSGVVLPHLAERLMNEDLFCLVPRLTDKSKAGLQTLFIPSAEKSHFKIVASSSVADGKPTVYPFDGIALYNRKKFIQLGGFDYTIQSPYWQNMDLAVRSWLWGEQTKITTLLQFSYIEEPPVEDKTVNRDYLKYFLKNECPILKNEIAYIKKSSFIKFLFQSSCGLIEARRLFKNAVAWVKKNKYRYKIDLKSFVENWKS